jgi:hypothetical protein
MVECQILGKCKISIPFDQNLLFVLINNTKRKGFRWFELSFFLPNFSYLVRFLSLPLRCISTESPVNLPLLFAKGRLL